MVSVALARGNLGSPTFQGRWNGCEDQTVEVRTETTVPGLNKLRRYPRFNVECTGGYIHHSEDR